MKVVYIAGPIRKGNIWANVDQADDAMLALMKAGVAVINPMLSCWAGAAKAGSPHPHPLAHGEFREMGADPWLKMDLELVYRSDAVLRLPGQSSGADGEVGYAIDHGKPVFFNLDTLLEWAKRGE